MMDGLNKVCSRMFQNDGWSTVLSPPIAVEGLMKIRADKVFSIKIGKGKRAI